jgi:hypothetical protein
MSAVVAAACLRLDEMPGTGPPCGGAEGVIAMGRARVIAALGVLLGLLGGVVTASPAVAGGRGPKYQPSPTSALP